MTAKFLTECLQDEGELQWLIGKFRENEGKSYLEIGSRFGGSFWKIASSRPRGARVVAIDMPASSEARDSLRACAIELQRRGYECHVMYGNSQSADIVKCVDRLAPFDACFIDADH